MGVNCNIVLPGNVRLKDVANVLGIAAGLTPRWFHSEKYFYSVAEVPGVETRPTTTLEGMAEIHLRGKLVDGWEKHFVLYHYEARGSGRLLAPRSTAFWIACGRRLVDFFGGKMDYQDCDDVRLDYEAPKKSNKENCPQDGKAWDLLQKRVMEVKAVTVEEWKEYEKYAAYKADEIRGE